LAQPLGESEVHGGVEGELALLLRSLDQRGRDRFGRGRRGPHGRGEHGRTQRGCRLEHVAPGESRLGHLFPPVGWVERRLSRPAEMGSRDTIAPPAPPPLMGIAIKSDKMSDLITPPILQAHPYTPNSLL